MRDDLDELTTALHDAVLPAGLPVLPTLDLAAHFSGPAELGESTGAWFDTTVLPSGRVALVVGQVAESGPPASAVASAVGAVVRAGLLDHEDVVRAVGLADLYARHTSAARGASLVVAILDPRTGELTFLTAGHEPPVAMSATSGTEGRLPRDDDGPLGHDRQRSAAVARIQPGDLLVLTSPDTPDTAPLGGARVAGDLTATCAAIAERLGGSRPRSAVAVIAAEVRRSRAAPLDVALRLDWSTPTTARSELDDWLRGAAVPDMDRLSLVHATLELVTNAVDHAHRPSDPSATVRLQAEHVPTGEVVVRVTDRGTWRTTEPDASRGRGLAMAAGLVDELDVVHTAEGTHGRLRHRLTRPVLVVTAPSPGRDAAPLRLTRVHPGAVRLSGDFGHDEVDQITYALQLASRGGTQRLEIDLTDVTDLCAGGVRLLGALVAAGASPSTGGHQPVVLHVRRGSAPHAHLDRAGIVARVS